MKNSVKSKWILAGAVLVGMVFLFSACSNGQKIRPPQKYTVTIEEVDGGKVTVSGSDTAYLAGAEVKLRVTTEKQYKLSYLWVIDANEEEIEISPEVSAAVKNYSFMMPPSDVTIYPEFTKQTQQYNITISEEVFGGTFILSDEKAYEGTEITVTAIPEEDWECAAESFTVIRTISGIDVTAQLADDDTWTFFMPGEDVEIWAFFVDLNDPDGGWKGPVVEPENPVTGVTLNQNTLNIVVGGTETLTATVQPGTAANKTVTWSTSAAGVATVANGTVTAVAVGTAVITVTTTDGGFTAQCAVTVNPVEVDNPGPGPIAVTGVTLNKTATALIVGGGGTETLTATVAPANATNKEVTWGSSNTAIATVTGGMVTAVGAGTATITVTTTDGNFTAQCTVTVTAGNTGEPPVIPMDPPETDFSQDGKTVQVDKPAAANYYEVQRSGSRLGTYTQILNNQTSASFTDPNPNPNKYENWYKIIYKSAGGQTLSEEIKSLEKEIFGDNMYFYDAKYDQISAIQTEVNNIHDRITLGSVTGPDGKRGEFTTTRHGMYFKPGTYNATGNRTLKIGFYTHVGGLGKTPNQASLVDFTLETPAHLGGNNATCTFWRSIENIGMRGGIPNNTQWMFHWGVSQAAPARRMKIDGASRFQWWWDGWSSGGFVADSQLNGRAGSESQQQWYARNSFLQSGFYGVNWNKVIQGCTGGASDGNTWEANGCRTVVPVTPVIREKPFLFIDDDGEYKVFVPALRRNATGPSWSDNNIGPGEAIDLRSKFYVAKSDTDTAATINTALRAGKHIFFTPGRYELEAPLHVQYTGTVLLGTGYATLIPGRNNPKGAVFVEDVGGVTVAGLLFDALYNSTYLLAVGDNGSSADHTANPTLLADLVLRVGGFSTQNVHVDIALLINSNNVIGDQFWVWRADHGDGVGWNRNTTKNGVVVKGNFVTLYGLFVEHFQEYQTLWLGEDGATYFYQNETPYDPPSQSVYMSHNNSVNGYAAYKVANTVNRHYATGLGIYPCFVSTQAVVEIANAIEVPNKPDVVIEHAVTVNISGNRGNTGAGSVVNGTGNTNYGGVRREYVVSYSGNTAVTPSNRKTGTQPPDEVFNLPTNIRP